MLLLPICTQEVDEQNRDLRSTISELHQENLQLNHLIAEDGQAAQEREGQTRLFLEREYREQLRVSRIHAVQRHAVVIHYFSHA